MKHLLTVCVALLFITANSWAEKINIKFMKGEKGEDLRSIVIEPTATQDGNTISISANVTIQNAQVAIKDMAGNIIFSTTTLIPTNQHYSFTLDNVENGDYILEVTYGDKYFYGYFAL